MKTNRIIWTFEKSAAKANEIAEWLRSRDFPTRVYRRTLSAEGLSMLGYAVVTDAAAAFGRPTILAGHCNLCGGMVSNNGVTCTHNCPADDGRGYMPGAGKGPPDDMTPLCLELVRRQVGVYCTLRRGHSGEHGKDA
jgi:hypothetical protein